MRKKAFAAAAAVLALGVAACGAPAPGNDTATPQASTSTKPDKFAVILDKDIKGPAPDVEGAQKGGTVNVITSVVPTKFDPTQAYYIDVLAVSRLTIRGLT